ncbi:DUF4062 domain-containing protein [Archangium lipolyticum]|uniref:DUF4062 domain-containing protein n=1 Tax=Archangium lipolyticum TaxID=2970465 RepID=UPI00214C457A|nr:DUF4062 domain-containing protein [Archangium lipolyticum]
MMKPHTFLSSTCYDLSTEREVLADHLRQLGHEPILSDSVKFPVTSGMHSHAACLEQVKRSNYFVLIIGGRRGGTAVHSEKSITNEEYNRAVKLRLPIYTFVKKEVRDAKPFYAKNPTADMSFVVDDKRIFDFIDQVAGASEDNWVKTFSTIAEVKEALTAQFAYNALLWSEEFVKSRSPGAKPVAPEGLAPLPGSFPLIEAEHTKDDAPELTKGIHKLHTLLGRLLTDNPGTYDEKVKLLWVIARHGDFDPGSGRWSMKEAAFKDKTWGTSRGNRVFQQVEPYGIRGEYDIHSDPDGRQTTYVYLRFSDRTDISLPLALNQYVKDLIKHYGPDRGLEMFRQADMTVYARV